jgi:two-component system capsular synthesis sensor histidine kinase RcsC
MSQRDATPVQPGAPTGDIEGLRRHSRRLIYGGGGLLSLLIVLTMLAGAASVVGDFHARQRQVFHDGQVAIDYFLAQRDRAYASSMNANDLLWATQQASLARNGAPLAQAFAAHGEQLEVMAEGKLAVPWLALGDGTAAMPPEKLAAYLAMLKEYSAYTAVTVTAVQARGAVVAYAYEPSGTLFAITGIRDEAQLLQALKVTTRAQAFALLREGETHLQGTHPHAGPVASSFAGERIVSYYGVNPVTGQPSLVGLLTLTTGGKPYFRRVVFESMDNIKMRLDATTKGSFVVVDGRGHLVLEHGAIPAGAVAAVAAARALAQGDAAVRREHRDGLFFVAGPLHGVDWTVAHVYTWSDLFAEQGTKLGALAGAAVLLLALLWMLLSRLDRRVFAPALADASRVYESEALSRVIIGTSPVGLCLLDRASGAPMVENDAACELAGVAPADAASPSLYADLIAHASAQGFAELHEFQWTRDRQDGRREHLQVSMALSSYLEHPVWVCALRDVTAQAELEENLRRARHDSETARQAAESASRAKSAFVATMSHEIRTPLNAVLGHLELLSRSRLEAPQRERIERIRLSADALLAIISDVLDFSKIEAGQLDIAAAPFALRPLVEQAALLYAPEAQRKGVKLFYAIDPTLAAGYVSDAHRIRQIVNNLLSNAVKFTESGRIVLRVAAGELAEAGMPCLRFQVIDSGIGMSAAQVSQLFEPFTQADASISRRYGGSGLGLALCRQLARLLGGEIRAESTAGAGSVFTLDLPVAPEQAPAAPSRPLEGQRVTLLSFAPEWRTEIGGLLSAWGATVTVIAQPVEATAPGDVLLIFGEPRSWSEEDERALVERHRRVIRAYANGPLVPETRDGASYLSCYASQALLAAIKQEPAVRNEVQAMPGVRAVRGRLLLVEDHAVNRELIQQQLEELGFEVDSAENGEDALRHWRAATYAAVLTDINMPVMDGYTFARALRERDRDVPILAITATALASERARCKAAGITDLLLKPLSLERLDEALARIAPGTAVAPAAAASRRFPEKVRRAFVDTGRQDLARLDEANRARDAQTLLDVVHSFKGVLLMMGERDAGEQCAALETRLRDEGSGVPAQDIRHLMERLDAVLRRFEAELEAQV